MKKQGLYFYLLMHSSLVAADDGIIEKLKPRFDFNYSLSSDRNIGMLEAWAPLKQNMSVGEVIYADLRFMDDNISNNEYNAGLGYRKIVHGIPFLGSGVAGSHIWFDRRRTKQNNLFNQVTLGGEWKGEDFDILANTYIPLTGDRSIESSSVAEGVSLVGNQVLVETSGKHAEAALKGVDLEIGNRLPYMENSVDALRAYIGTYHFWDSKADNVTGFRTRIMADITSDISLGSSYQYDDERGSKLFANIKFRFPWGHKKSFQKNGLYARLDESPERDIDIVSAEFQLKGGGLEPLLSTDGNEISIYHVDNTAGSGGNGSLDNPFNQLSAAEASAGENDIIYVHEGDGTSTGQNSGITLDDDGQVLAGSGSDFYLDSSKYSLRGGELSNNLKIAATSAPVISNTTGHGITVTADNVVIDGISVNGANTDGINAVNAKNLTIKNSSIKNSGQHGINGSSANGAGVITFDNINIDTATNSGLKWDFDGTANSTFTIKDSVFSNNALFGVQLAHNDDSDINLNITNTTISNTNIADAVVGSSEGNGVSVLASDNSKLNLNIDSNIFTNNLGDAFYVNSGVGSTGVDISGSITNNEFRNAIYQSATSTTKDLLKLSLLGSTSLGSATDKFVISNNTFDNDHAVTTSNVKNGFDLSMNGTSAYIDFDDNTIANTVNGLDVNLESNASLELNVNNNEIENNEWGIILETQDSGASILGSITNNTITNNYTAIGSYIADNGYIGTSLNPLLIQANTIKDNSSDGIDIYVEENSAINSIIRNNKLNNNGTNNILIDSYTSANLDLDLVIDNNEMIETSGSTDNGLNILTYGNVDLDLSFTNNQLVGISQAALTVDDYSSGLANIDLSNNTFDGSSENTVTLSLDGGGSTDLDIINNNIYNSGKDGLLLTGEEVNITADIKNNTINSSNLNALAVSFSGTTNAVVDIDNNTIDTTTTSNGIYLLTNDESTVTGSVSDNNVSNTAGRGILLSARGLDSADTSDYSSRIGTAASALSVESNTVTNSGSTGIEVVTNEEGMVNLKLESNIIYSNSLKGLGISELDSQTGQSNIVVDLGGGVYGSLGNNSIYDNAEENVYYDADIATTLQAQNNWWGRISDPSTFDEVTDSDGNNEFGGINATINAIGWLNTDPN